LNNYYSNSRPEVALFLPNTTKRLKILDIGCGKGNFRKNITSDCEYWGIEPEIKSAKIAAKKLDKVLVGKFNNVFDKLPEKYFDCIICADVISDKCQHADIKHKISDIYI
jgi:2-polyprenyl-3-methyl-5-hydroxy-6-metoxy-1,4-benzoquinol methylase